MTEVKTWWILPEENSFYPADDFEGNKKDWPCGTCFTYPFADAVQVVPLADLLAAREEIEKIKIKNFKWLQQDSELAGTKALLEMAKERIDRDKTKLERYEKALEEIANEDFRGNRPAASVKAYKALGGE